MKTILTLAMATLLAGCANRPETIHASFVSHERFMDMSCIQLTNKMSSTRAELGRFSTMQDSKANTDAFGVFFFGIPFSKLSGDHEGDVARLKGEVEALETAQIKTRCGDGGAVRTVNNPAMPGTLQQYPTHGNNAAPIAYAANGQDVLTAQAFAKTQRCAADPRATLVAKGPGFETYSLLCANADTMVVRCEFGNCRALR